LVQFQSDFRFKLSVFLYSQSETNNAFSPVLLDKSVHKLRSSIHSQSRSRWQEQNRPQENLPEARPRESNWPPRLHVRVHQPLVELRSHTDTGPELSLSVKSEGTRRALNCSSGNCPSSVWYVKLHRISRPISDSRALPLWLSRKLAKLTWSDFSRIPTCAPSTPSVSPLCQRTFSWPAVSVVNVLKQFSLKTLNGPF
jgi:hypothetical protein